MKEDQAKKRGYGIRVNDALTLHILPTANAWWMDYAKTSKLVDAIVSGLKIREACESTEISVVQYKYFARKHPQINRIRKMYKSSKAIRGQLSVSEVNELNPTLAHKNEMLLKKISVLEKTISSQGREIGSLRSSLTTARKTIETLRKGIMPHPEIPMTEKEIAEWQGANYPSFTYESYEALLETFHPESAQKIREQWIKDKSLYHTSSVGISLEELERWYEDAKKIPGD